MATACAVGSRESMVHISALAISKGAVTNHIAYDYQGAARDAIHYPKNVDRLWQNMRRVVGYDVQYMGTLEPQRRLAPQRTPRPTSTPTPAKPSPPGTRPSTPSTTTRTQSPRTWSGSAPSCAPKASWPACRRPSGASAT